MRQQPICIDCGNTPDNYGVCECKTKRRTPKLETTADYLRMNTCFLIEKMEVSLNLMKDNGMPHYESDKVDKMIDVLCDMNQKYCRLSEPIIWEESK